MLIFSFILRRVFFFLLRRKIKFKGGGKSVLFSFFFFSFFVSYCSLCFIERPEMCCQSFVSCLTNSKFRNGAGQGGEGSPKDLEKGRMKNAQSACQTYEMDVPLDATRLILPSSLTSLLSKLLF